MATLAVIGFAVLKRCIGGAVMAQQSQIIPTVRRKRQQPAPRPQTQRPSTNNPKRSRAPAQQTGASQVPPQIVRRKSTGASIGTGAEPDLEHQANQRQLNNEMNGRPTGNENRPPSATNGTCTFE